LSVAWQDNSGHADRALRLGVYGEWTDAAKAAVAAKLVAENVSAFPV
jgi:hypothetical protein